MSGTGTVVILSARPSTVSAGHGCVSRDVVLDSRSPPSIGGATHRRPREATTAYRRFTLTGGPDRQPGGAIITTLLKYVPGAFGCSAEYGRRFANGYNGRNTPPPPPVSTRLETYYILFYNRFGRRPSSCVRAWVRMRVCVCVFRFRLCLEGTWRSEGFGRSRGATCLTRRPPGIDR